MRLDLCFPLPPLPLAAALLLLAGACGEPASQRTDERPGALLAERAARSTVEARVEVHPLEQGHARFVAVADDGRAQAVRFDPHARHVLAVADVVLEGERRAAAERWLADPALRALAAAGPPAPDGIVIEGATFALVLDDGEAVRRAAGVLEALAPERRALVLRAWELVDAGDGPAPGPAYARALRVPAERARALRAGGRLAFHARADLPATLRPTLEGALARPGRFHALDAARIDALRALCSHGADAYLVDGDATWEVALYEVPAGRAPASKTEERDEE